MNSLAIVEHKSERILTTKQLADFYGASTKNIKDNFHNHKLRFQDGKHFFKLEGQALREFKNKVDNIDLVGKNASVLYLWTEKGALRHAKILDTERAWEVFEMLEDNYFKSKPLNTYKLPKSYSEALRELATTVEEKERLEQENKIMLPKVQQYDTFLSTKSSQAMNDVAKALGYGRNKLFSFLRNKKILMKNNLPYQEYMDRGYFEVREITINHSDWQDIKRQTLVTTKGVDYISKKLKSEGLV